MSELDEALECIELSAEGLSSGPWRVHLTDDDKKKIYAMAEDLGTMFERCDELAALHEADIKDWEQTQKDIETQVHGFI